MKEIRLKKVMNHAIVWEDELTVDDQIHYALRLGIQVEKSMIATVYESQRCKFATKYPDLKTLKMPKIIAIVIPSLKVRFKDPITHKYVNWYASANDVFDKIRGTHGVCPDEYGDEYDGMGSFEKWNEQYESGGFMLPKEIYLDRKKRYALYEVWDINLEIWENGYRPYWFIVLRSTSRKPFFKMRTLEHELRHVLEMQLNEESALRDMPLDLKIGTLSRESKRAAVHKH